MFKMKLIIIPTPRARNRAYIFMYNGITMATNNVMTVLIKKYLKVYFSLPRLFSIEVVRVLSPVGTIVHDENFRYRPASILSNKNIHRGSANPISNGMYMKEQHMVKLIEPLICL